MNDVAQVNGTVLDRFYRARLKRWAGLEAPARPPPVARGAPDTGAGVGRGA